MDENMNKWSGENPWMGLGAYSEGQRLYGRDKETATLTDIIINHTAIVVYGKSGIGKSSLLKAGVFPLLRQQHFIPIYLRLAHNTDISYIQQIENAISESLTLQNLLPDSIPILGFWDYLHRHRFTDVEGNAVTPVIVLDQFEEIFTLTQVDHKADIQVFFSELADVLNDVKPDKVIQAEASYTKSVYKPSKEPKPVGFSLQPLSKSALKYEKSPSFRFVISLRDDSLYLLERNSAKIPALKANRYNLNALDEENVMEVIMKPCPGLFSETEGKEILDGLAYYEYDDYRVVDPAIISLFLYSYYKEQGKIAYTDIFERYYQDCTKDIGENSISYIEDHLLTDRGNRNQIPLNDLTAMGISASEMDLLLQRKILKTEKRKGIDYVEFSHDRLCEQALKHREERKLREQTKIMRKKMGVLGLVTLFIIGIILVFALLNRQKRLIEEKEARTQVENIEVRRLNDSLQKQYKIIELQNDSINKLNDSLNKKVFIIDKQKDSIIFKSDSLQELLSKNIKLGIEKQELLTQYIQKSDKLERTIKIMQAQEGFIEQQFNDELIKNEIPDTSVNQVMPIYLDIRDALEAGNRVALVNANNRLKEKQVGYFSSLRSNTDNPSLDGHFIFNCEFIDSLVSGTMSFSNTQLFEYQNAVRSVSMSSGLVARTCTASAEKTAQFSFSARGHQEIAAVTEPGGLISLRVHDLTHDIWYNDTKQVIKGQASQVIAFDLPSNTRSTLKVEVINKSNKDISFVIISN